MNTTKLAQELHEAEVKAIKALAGYKFAMFGYWAGIWVHLNRIEGTKRPSPFKALVHAAREYPVEQGGRAMEKHGTGIRSGKLAEPLLAPLKIPYEPDPPEWPSPGRVRRCVPGREPDLVDADLSDGKTQYSLSPKTVTRIVGQAFAQVRQSGRASIELYQVSSPNDFTVVWALVIDSGEIKIRLMATGDPVDRKLVEFVMTNDVNYETYRYRVGGGL